MCLLEDIGSMSKVEVCHEMERREKDRGKWERRGEEAGNYRESTDVNELQ